MRDIRSDLRERLDAAVKQHTELAQRLRAMEARAQRLRAMLEDEEASPEHSGLVAARTSTNGARLRAFVLESLADGHDWSLEDLKEHARGTGGLTAGVTAGRSLNITLVTLRRDGKVERRSDGRWRLQDDGGQLALKLPLSSTVPDQEASEWASLRRPA